MSQNTTRLNEEPKAKPQSKMKQSIFAAAMGDIVGSETRRTDSAFRAGFNAAIESTNRQYHTALASPLTITLGDEFQGLVKTAVQSFDLVLDLRHALLARRIPCRFVIGIVKLNSKLNPQRAWNMMGDGFGETREKLNNKKDPNVYRFFVPDPVRQRLLDAAGLSLTEVEQDWTERQLRYVQLRRETNSSGKIAHKLGVTVRVVYKVLEAARWNFYREQIESIRFALAGLDEELRLP